MSQDGSSPTPDALREALQENEALRDQVTQLRERVMELKQMINARDQIEEALRLSHDELEDLVAESTTELVHSEERFRSLVQTAPDFIMILNADASIRFINRTRPEKSLNEVIGASGLEFLHPDDRPLAKECILNVLETGGFERFQTRAHEPDGELRWYSARLGPFVENGEIVGVTSFVTDITQQKMAEERLIAEERLLRRLLNLHERERQLIAHDIHDGFVQYLTGARMMLDAARFRLQQQGDPNLKQILDASDLLSKAISEARRLIGDLRPIIIDERGVVDAIKYLIADIESKSDFTVHFFHDVMLKRQDPMLEGALFRVVQEALTNVQRHSGASEATVRMSQQGDEVRLVIEDQGSGFEFNKIPPDRFGVRGIQERARLFGGSSNIQSKLGVGTTITVQVPLSEAEEPSW